MTGPARRGRKFDPEAALVQQKLAAANVLKRIADEAGLSLTHMAVAFVLEHPAVTSAITGPRTMKQLEDLLAGADLRLDREVIDRIDKLCPPGTSLSGLDPTSRPLGLQKPQRRRPGNA